MTVAPAGAARPSSEKRRSRSELETTVTEEKAIAAAARAGFKVTVYGGSYWRAMLTITPAAGGVRNPQEWRDLTNDLAERLRKHYDLAFDY